METNINIFEEEKIEQKTQDVDIEYDGDKDSEKITIGDLINFLKEAPVNYFEMDIRSAERSDIKNVSFILMKFCSNSYKEIIDKEKARGRKKGDGKGKWPTKKIPTENTFKRLLLTNEYSNKNFWNLYKYHDLQFAILYAISLNARLEDRENLVLPPNPRKKGKKKVDSVDIEDLIKKAFPELNKTEVEIIKNSLENLSEKETLIEMLKSYCEEE